MTVSIQDKGKKVNIDKFKNKFENIKYGNNSERQVMDILIPEGEGPFPVVLYIHGGSWVSGDKRKYTKKYTFKLPSQGYVLATINYRLAPNWIWPSQAEDVLLAIEELINNHKKYNIDLNNFFVWGDSAGAHLAQFVVANNTNNKHINIRALISFYGITNMRSLEKQAKNRKIFYEVPIMEHPYSPICMLIGETIKDNKNFLDKLEKASPINYISRDFPPTLIQHGDKDSVVPVDQSIEFFEKIKEKSPETDVRLEIFENADHASEVFKEDKNINRCIDFLDEFAYCGKNPHRKKLPDIQIE